MRWKTEENYWQQDMRNRDRLLAIVKGLGGIGILAYLFYHSWIGYAALLPLLFLYYRTWKKEYAKRVEEEKEKSISLVAASERERAQTGNLFPGLRTEH